MPKAKVQVGDRFVTIGSYPTTWIVEREIHSPMVTPHFQLSQEGQPNRVKTLSEAVLVDDNQHRKIPSASSAAA